MSTQRFGWIGFFSMLACAWSFEGVPAAADPAGARTLVEQAIAAQGGMKALETIGATIVATKGKLNELGEATFQAETFSQVPYQYRLVMSIETDGNRIPYVDVLNGDRAWNRVADQVQEVTGPTLTEMRLQAYVNHVASLVPLLREEGFTLETEAGQMVDNAPAEVVVVRKKNMPDVRLGFNVQSHLLIKIDHTRFDPTSGKDAHFEEFPQDYHVVDLTGPDRKTLAAAKIGSDAASLKAFLRKQTLDPGEQKLVQAQIKALGDDKFAKREEAKNSLIKMGPRVTALLEEATHSSDPEIASRARECLEPLGKGPSPELLGAVVRAFAYAHDPEALDVLLAYLPAAGDDVVAKEVRSALAALAASDPKAKNRLTAASQTGNSAMRKALASVVNSTKNAGDVGFRVYPPGVMQAMKGVKLRDGKKTAEWETTEIRFYHSLPNSTFDKP
jgi:hypothetical protein